MNSVLVNPKLFILEKVNLAPPTIGWSTWSNLVKLGQTCSNVLQLVLFSVGHYKKCFESISLEESYEIREEGHVEP